MSLKIDLKIFLFLLLFFFTSQIELYVLLMVFALIHEFGHLLAGVILGFKPKEFRITPVGMKIEFEIQCEEYNQKILKGNSLTIKKAIIAIAGPLTNFLIITVLIIFSRIYPKLQEICFLNMKNITYINIIYTNLIIGIFNLIPIYPLDGGRIIKEILHIICGLKKSDDYTYFISKACIIVLTALSSIAILYIQNISILIIIMYLWGLMMIESKRYHTKRKVHKIVQYEKHKKSLAN